MFGGVAGVSPAEGVAEATAGSGHGRGDELKLCVFRGLLGGSVNVLPWTWTRRLERGGDFPRLSLKHHE